MFVALAAIAALTVFLVPATAAPSGSGIVASVAKAPIDPVGDVAGERTDFVINLDGSLDPSVDGRALLAGNTIKVTLPEDFEYLGGPVTNPGPPPGCPPTAGTCGTGVLLQGWPQNPIPPSPANYTLSLEGTHTVVYTATRDLVPGDLTLNGPGIKQMHLILTNYVNPNPGRYEFQVTAETGPGGAVETGIGVVRIRPRPRASINVTSVLAGPPPFANTIFQTTGVGEDAPHEWSLLIWDRLGEPALGVSVHQVNRRSAQIVRDGAVVGHIKIQAPKGARGQAVAGGPSTAFVAPVKGEDTGLLAVQFTAGNKPGLYTTTLRMNNGTSVAMYVTATD
jgi:hypothetical protein